VEGVGEGVIEEVTANFGRNALNFTAYRAVGEWGGKRELCIVYEVIIEENAPPWSLRLLARDSFAFFNQQAVLYTCHQVEASIWEV